MILQLNPPIPVTCPKGDGLAHAMIDYGIEHHIYWVVFITATGECWTYANPEVRVSKNISYGRLFNGYHDKKISTMQELMNAT